MNDVNKIPPIISFAQKGLVLDESKTKILVNKYLESKFMPEKVSGKFGLPGGQIEFGEDVDEAFIREVEEETGIIIKPSIPVKIYSWVYSTGDRQKQIIAVARLAFVAGGQIREPDAQKETKLEKAQWIVIEDINSENFISDEHTTIEEFKNKLSELLKLAE